MIATLHRATVAALNDPAVRKSLGDLGVDIVGSTPEEFAAYIKAEIPKWTAIVKASGATGLMESTTCGHARVSGHPVIAALHAYRDTGCPLADMTRSRHV